MKIKALIISAACLLGLAANANAQLHDNEISLSYGLISSTHVSMTFGGVFQEIITGGNANIDDITSTGSIGVEYMRWLGKHIAVGGAAMFENVTIKYTDNTPNETTGLISIMPAVKANWFNRNHFGMYSKGMLGVSIMTDKSSSDDSPVMFSAQLSPICADFGGMAFRGFVELGWGVQGLVTAGLRYSF